MNSSITFVTLKRFRPRLYVVLRGRKPAHSAGIAARFSRLGLLVLSLSCVLLAHTARLVPGPLSDGPECSELGLKLLLRASASLSLICCESIACVASLLFSHGIGYLHLNSVEGRDRRLRPLSNTRGGCSCTGQCGRPPPSITTHQACKVFRAWTE